MALERAHRSLVRRYKVQRTPKNRSKAGRRLPKAGRLANGPLGKAGRAVPGVGAGLTYFQNRAEGKGIGESATRAGITGAGGGLGALAGGAACATETVATLGAGVVACPVLVGGGAVGGSIAGDKTGDAVFGN